MTKQIRSYGQCNGKYYIFYTDGTADVSDTPITNKDNKLPIVDKSIVETPQVVPKPPIMPPPVVPKNASNK